MHAPWIVNLLDYTTHIADYYATVVVFLTIAITNSDLLSFLLTLPSSLEKRRSVRRVKTRRSLSRARYRAGSLFGEWGSLGAENFTNSDHCTADYTMDIAEEDSFVHWTFLWVY